MPSTALVPFSPSALSAQANAISTMSSREIAELTGKDHRNVTRDVEKMLKDVGEGVLNFEHTYHNEQNGQDYREFRLPKNLTLNLIAGYRADIRLKIIDRWLEMESAQAPRIPTNFREALLRNDNYAVARSNDTPEDCCSEPKGDFRHYKPSIGLEITRCNFTTHSDFWLYK